MSELSMDMAQSIGPSGREVIYHISDGEGT